MEGEQLCLDTLKYLMLQLGLFYPRKMHKSWLKVCPVKKQVLSS